MILGKNKAAMENKGLLACKAMTYWHTLIVCLHPFLLKQH